MIKVSIIVPVFNTEKYLDKCIKSLINQTLKEIEIILVDDGSTDKSGTICDKYEKKDKRVRVIHKKNKGAAMARNSGLEIANGEYIAFVDSDDYIDLNFYETLYKHSNNIEVIFGEMKSVNSIGKVKTQKEISNERIFKNEEIKKVLYEVVGGKIDKNRQICFSACMAIYKKNIIDKYNIRFKKYKYAEDCIFNIEYLSKCRAVLLIGGTNYYYVENKNSTTRTYDEKKFEKIKSGFLEIVKKLKELEIYEDTSSGLYYSFLGHVRACIKQEIMNNKPIALKNIMKICDDEYVQQVLNRKYDKTIKQKIFDFLIKKKKANVLYNIIKLQNYIN